MKYSPAVKQLLFRQGFKNPVSLISLFIIAIAYLLIHFLNSKNQVSGLTFLIYLSIFILGMGFTRKTLLLWFSDLNITLTILALAFGTNLLYIVSLDYQLQPILLFSLYAMVVFLTAAWHEQQKQTYAVALAIGLGLIILIQPTGMFSLLIPVLWGVHNKASWKLKIIVIKDNYRQAYLFLTCLSITVLAPVLLWKILPGEIPLLSFQLPGVFISFSSWFWNDLFSFDHGWLIYSPLMLLSFIGFYFFAEKNRSLFYAVFLFCFLDLFLETSWSKLGSTPVFGQVAFIPACALFVLPLASIMGFIQTGKIFYRLALSLVTVIFIILNIFQTWQFSNGIIIHSGMNAENYSQAFGRTFITEYEKLKNWDIEPGTNLIFNDESRFRKINLAIYDFENPQVSSASGMGSAYAKNGKSAFAMDPASSFSPALDIPYGLLLKNPVIGMRITASVFVTEARSFSGVNFVISSVHEGNNYRYKTLNLGNMNLKPGMWHTVSYDYLFPADPYPGDRLVSYVWYTGSEKVYIDDLRYDAFEYKK